MKILTWNCQGAFRRKAQPIADLAPDIAVIQECESPARLRWAKDVTPPNDYVWYGINPHKGVGIFSWTDWTFAIDPSHDPSIQHCVPVVAKRDDDQWTMADREKAMVNGHSSIVHLLAIWAMGHKKKEFSYVGQVYQGVHRYFEFLQQRPTFVLGDWNSNAIWDRERKMSNHSNVIKKLAEAEIVSLYHEHFGEAHGKETMATYWHQRSQIQGYHLDYCASPKSWLPRVKSLQLGAFDEWGTLSDHSPLIVELNS